MFSLSVSAFLTKFANSWASCRCPKCLSQTHDPISPTKQTLFASLCRAKFVNCDADVSLHFAPRPASNTLAQHFAQLDDDQSPSKIPLTRPKLKRFVHFLPFSASSRSHNWSDQPFASSPLALSLNAFCFQALFDLVVHCSPTSSCNSVDF